MASTQMGGRMLRVAGVLLALGAGAAQAQDVVPEAAAKASFESGKVVPPVALNFEAGGDTLQTDSKPGIAAVAAFLKEKESMTTVRVEGHVGSLGEPEASQLGGKRALAVTRALVAAGVDCKRLLPVTFGSNKPMVAKGGAENTRVEIIVAGLRGRAIGGMPLDGSGLVVGDACAK